MFRRDFLQEESDCSGVQPYRTLHLLRVLPSRRHSSNKAS